MNKKIIIGIILAIVIIAVAIGVIVMMNTNKNITDTTENKSNIGKIENENEGQVVDNKDEEKEEKEVTSSNQSKTLVVYYSAQSHTKAVAEKIAENLNADIFEIEPEEKYTSEDLNWTNNNSRVSREHNDESLRNVKLLKDKVENWEDYDTILIGYPIWWGIAAWPVDTFVKANNFEGKTVIPFCTSASSGLGQSGKLLEREANSGNWEDGHRFNERPSDSDIKKWADSLK